jgi:hypothetical protein
MGCSGSADVMSMSESSRLGRDAAEQASQLHDTQSDSHASLGGPAVLRDRDLILFGSVSVTFRAWRAGTRIP